MTPYLETYLENVVPEVRSNLIKRAIDILLKLGHDEVNEMIDVILSVSDDFDNVEILSRIEACVVSVYDDVLGEYGVGIGNPGLSTVTYILETLLTVEEYDDPESVLSILDDDGSTEERFAEVVTLITNRDTMMTLESITHVSPSLLDRMVDILNGVLDLRTTSVEREYCPTAKPTHLKAFLKKHPSAKLNVMLAEGWQLGLPVEMYLDETLNDDNQTYRSIALNYMAGALASGMDPSKAYQMASKYLEIRYEDTHFLHQIISHVSTYLDGDFNESA